ncbi:MAG TPA: S9 family peptidase [Planctomycetota bacterium]|nr:S9 family peptidase [Planctomycetota bacterium]
MTLLAALALALPQTAKHPLTVDDMLAMERVSDPQVSPDGKWVAFTLRTTDMEANRGRNDVWVAAIDGSSTRRLTTHPDSDSGARWMPDGKSLVFLSTRGGSSQVWRIAVAGGEAEALTHLPLDVENLCVFPDGKRLAFTMEVWPDATPQETVERDAEKEKRQGKVRIYDSLPIRHWDTWEDGKRSHVFVWTLGGGDPVDLMKGIDADAPTKPFGGVEQISISPDGAEVVFAAKVAGREAMWSTNVDLWAAPSDASKPPRCLTADNKALDDLPAISPDGKWLAYVAMARPGFEADRQRVVLLDRASGKRRVLTESWDRSAAEIAWSRDGRTIYATADDTGNKSLFAIDVSSGNVAGLVSKGTCSSPQSSGDRIVYLHDSLTSPAEIVSIAPDASDGKPVTSVNAARVAAIEWGSFEPFSFPGAKGEKVYGFVMKPAGDVKGKVPVALLVHGGPQGSFGDHFHYRWNPEFYAGAGYAAVFIDFHGSTGYGQAFTDAIRLDWGGAPYEDLMKGLDYAIAKYPYLDGSRVAALGASYGGYMMNWIAGNTDRFRCIVTHASNLDERLAYFDTEELWFPEWEHGGTPWEHPEGYAKHDPIDFVKNWKTPTLVTHGANDYRVVDTQGISVFTALQRRGVPSRLVYFPDENHWVLKPKNSKLWHGEVLAWLNRWCRDGAPSKSGPAAGG